MAEATTSITWTDELKAKVLQMYKDAEPTPANTLEIIKDIAEELGASPNGVRMILSQAKAYVKTDGAASKPASKDKKEAGEGSKRVSKESQIAELRAAIEERGAKADDDILSKLTGKAAAYFVTVLKT